MKLKKYLILTFLPVITLFIIYLAILIGVSIPIEEYSIDKAATIGDSFGVINALFSGCAFSGLIITIIIQREELNESREIFKSQKFEDAFYRLLAFYKENLNEISIHDNNVNTRHKGVAGLSHQLRRLHTSIRSLSKHLNNDKQSEMYKVLIHSEIQKELIHQSRYLGTMESILSLILDDIASTKKRNFYVKMVSSQLTIHEVKYIFYRCLVSKTESSLVYFVNESKLIEMRIAEANINPQVVKLYNDTHGASFTFDKNRHDSIYTKAEEIKMKKNLINTIGKI
jgi:hypothetical protein